MKILDLYNLDGLNDVNRTRWEPRSSWSVYIQPVISSNWLREIEMDLGLVKFSTLDPVGSDVDRV